MDYINIIIGSLPMIGTIIGIYVKMNNVIIRQDMKIEHLEAKINEIQVNAEKLNNILFKKLEEMDRKMDDVRMHAFSCINFKTNKNG
jgi:hypothetical protein